MRQNILSYGWLTGKLEGEDPSESQRIVDELGIGAVTEGLANKILPNINTRYYSIQYYPIVCIGIKLVNEYLTSRHRGEEEESEKNAETHKPTTFKYFRSYMDYYEYWVAYLQNMSGQTEFIGVEKCKAKPFKIDVLTKDPKRVRKQFLTSPVTYAYDRYKSSLRYCGLLQDGDYIKDSRLTDKGEAFTKELLRLNDYGKLYEIMRNIFFKKKEPSHGIILRPSKQLKNTIYRLLVGLEYSDDKNEMSRTIETLYNSLRKEPFKNGLFPRISLTRRNKQLQATLEQMKELYDCVKPILLIINSIRRKSGGLVNVRAPQVPINTIINPEIRKLLNKANRIVASQHFIRIFKEDKTGLLSFLRKIYKDRSSDHQTLRSINGRIYNVKGLPPYKLGANKIILNNEYWEKAPKGFRADVSKYRIDILWKIKNEIKG